MTAIFDYKYVPILSISPAEMTALNELPKKDKDKMLPLFSLKGWVASRLLANSTNKIKDVIDNRPWIADIDAEFLNSVSDGEKPYPREVYHEIERLLDSGKGYANWCNFIKDISNAIPTIQLGDLDQLVSQTSNLNELDKGLVIRFNLHDINSGIYTQVLDAISQLITTEIMILFDLEKITSDEVIPNTINNLCSVINIAHTVIPSAKIVISASSFPDGFSPYTKGENPIHERILFNKLQKKCDQLTLVYSDRGSARAKKNGGRGGVPKPRIDYPLFYDWRFVRKNAANDANKKERAALYSEAAREIVSSDYWDSELKLWGTQLIQLTGQEDDFGIDNPNKSTAVRINIHLHNQLYYGAPRDSQLDTDEDWED